jgi:tetratricopeptide (TPR) repeat protein
MKTTICIIVLICSSLCMNASGPDSLNFQSQIDRLDLAVKMVQQNQLNYSIEKDILKENYKSTFDRINITITIVLGLFTIIGFFGLKDLNSVKRTYTEELSNLKNLHEEFKLKTRDFDSTKKAYQEELEKILKENKDQTRKIQILEFKEKIRDKFKNNNYTEAMEYCVVALSIEPEDQTILELKGRIHMRLGQVRDSIKTFENLVQLDPKNESSIANLVETYYLANDLDKGRKLIIQNKSYFDLKCKGKLMQLLDIIEIYQTKSKDELINKISTQIEKGDLDQKQKRIEGWDLTEALYSTLYSTDEKALVLRNFFWFWDGQISAKDLIKRLGLNETNYTS